jgi:polyhydroxybutyrate depolymerase
MGNPAVTPSEGCGIATDQNEGAWVESQVASGGGMRPYSVWLPTNYDPMRAYPAILLLHGCGSGTNNVPVERHTGADAIVVRGTGSSGNCWDDKANGADVPYVEAIVEDVKARFCTDVNAWFAVGYSSGSWLANTLGCIHSDIFRGLATVAGGLPGGGMCLEQPIAHMFVHDQGDMSNGIAGSEAARDRLLKLNGCDMPATSAPVDPSPCVSYAGCQSGYPVLWCKTTGEDHNRQDAFTGPEFWKFFQSLLTP